MKIVNFKLKIRIFLSALGLCLFFPTSIVSAASNFQTDYKAVYIINKNDTTHADIKIVLTNTSSKFYASSYQIQLGFDDVSNIKASDPEGPIKTELTKTSDGSNILLKFNKKAYGINSKIPFSLSFDTSNILHHAGNVWEIEIPGIKNPEEFQVFTVEVKVPNDFGEPTIIKPAQASNTLKFDKTQLGKSGISIAFGNIRVYDFKLKYHLKNTNLFPIKSEIAIPPDTNYQKVFIGKIEPKPENVIIDADGNWLAKYSLSPAQEKNINIEGNVDIKHAPQTSTLSPTERKEYLKSSRYWPSNDPKILKLTKDLKTAGQIYNYVARSLKYDFTRVAKNKARLGGLGALNNPNSATCREFTDLFITLSRAAGIPAREVDGFAYTENNHERPVSLVRDILHAWPEYYDDKANAWIMVDPTWGSTTGEIDYFHVLDFDHFAFVIKGRSDSYPITAGGYKNTTDKSEKDVNVTFSKHIIKKGENVDLQSPKRTKQIAGFAISEKVKILNKGGYATVPQLLYVSSQELSPKNRGFEIPIIPPFGFFESKISMDRKNFLTKKDLALTMRFGDKKLDLIVSVLPFFNYLWN